MVILGRDVQNWAICPRVPAHWVRGRQARSAAQQSFSLGDDLGHEVSGRLDGGDEVGPFPGPDQADVGVPGLMAAGEAIPGAGACVQFCRAPVPDVGEVVRRQLCPGAVRASGSPIGRVDGG